MAQAIALRGLGHAFGEGEARREALFGITLDIPRGQVVALRGASGSGKTTLLTLIGCLRAVQEGEAALLGTRLDGADAETLVQARRSLGFIFQAHNLHESLTALQNVRLGAEVHGRLPRAEAASRHALALLGLADRTDYLPARLSGGQKQRVAIARALVGNPEVILADEPTAALDRENGVAAVALLRRLARERGTTTLMVTHDPQILELADRILTLRDGRLVEDRLVA
jgi:putative ABC transport system ATP-binding protein